MRKAAKDAARAIAALAGVRSGGIGSGVGNVVTDTKCSGSDSGVTVKCDGNRDKGLPSKGTREDERKAKKKTMESLLVQRAKWLSVLLGPSSMEKEISASSSGDTGGAKLGLAEQL